MKIITPFLLAACIVFGAQYSDAEMKHEGHNSHEGHSMPHDMKGGDMNMKTLHIDGYKALIHVMDRDGFRKHMDAMGHESHKMKKDNTHYIMMELSDKDGNKIKKAKVRLKVVAPSGEESDKVGFPMMGNFGNEFRMKEGGKYEIKAEFKLKDGHHHGSFSYNK